jgi:hypothetical protein
MKKCCNHSSVLSDRAELAKSRAMCKILKWVLSNEKKEPYLNRKYNY